MGGDGFVRVFYVVAILLIFYIVTRLAVAHGIWDAWERRERRARREAAKPAEPQASPDEPVATATGANSTGAAENDGA